MGGGTVQSPQSRVRSFCHEEGFRIRFDYRRQQGGENLARKNPEPIDRYVRAELQEGHFIRLPGNTPVRVSRGGVIPKLHQPGK